ncbi:immunoglobulin-like and fibronectin type III domain-containing protein 1 isoform X2 [Corythoichthys intestinalis]|uniref:immunoglobulin-like and fibronectin type III domain-containing protein 1 isoform X2 n=1 Tax=Corythoichthys intestinalis TaxID=161448 RepID=UPI0025A5E64F|nr:immunoglobulin-like and fibronectin type III domain-containing protein 1 isoform X2 [Corythoichthys intestinalis]
MSKRPKGSGRKVCFSLVHQYIQHFNEKAGNKSAAIRRRSKIPGVIITQYTLNIPEGKSVPDFKRKVNQVNVQEGKLGVFKALVTAEPKPQVTWKRVRGSISDKQKYQTKYDDSTGEYILEVRAVTGEDEDTYKCIAVNDYGKAICSTTLNVTDHVTDPSDFRKMLRKTNSNIFEENQTEKTKERDERYRDTLQRDYDGLGTTDMHLMHLKMEERQRALKYQKGMSPPDEEILMKNGLINGGNATDAENLTIPNLDFVVKLQEAITEEKDTALFECVLTHPLPEITWMSKGNVLEDGEKYKITVSDHKMIHRLQIQNCSDEDKGDYSAVAGNASCTAPLDVEADLKAAGKKKTEGAGIDLEEVVRQQQKKNQEEMEMILEAVKAKHDAGELTEQKTLTTYGEDGEIISLTGPVQYSGSDVHDANDNSNIITSMLNVLSPSTGEKSDVTEDSDAGNQMEEETANAGQDGANACDDVNTLFCADGANACDDVNTLKKKKYDSLFNEDSENEEVTGFATQPRRKRIGPLIEDKVIDPGVQFIWGLSDINAIIGENAELTCKLSKEDCEGVWFRDGVQIITDDTFIISKEGAIHKLFIMKCQEEYSGKYRFEADNRKTEATVNVKDPPRFDPEDLSAFTEPLRIKVGHNAVFKLNFLGFEPIKIQWYREGEELHDDASSTRIEKATNHSRLLLSRCQRRDSGEIKIKLKNEHGTTEAITQLIVLDKPTTPLGPAEITLSSATCIEFKWRPPKDDGGSPVINYIMERQQIGRNTWKKIGEIPGVPFYRDTDVDRGRKYCYRIRALTSEGVSEVMETEDLQAGILVRPKFTNKKMKTFMVVRAGNSVRVTINFEASPPPDIMWLKDNGPVPKRVTVSNSDGASQMLIPLSERSDSGIYSILVKNLAGQETFSTEVRVTDDPKPPGPVEIEENVPGTVQVTWQPSPDEKLDDRLHYTISKLDSTKHTWTTVADRLFNNKFTVCNIMHGREYHFRVYAKNDMGVSAPSESATWAVGKKKEKLSLILPNREEPDLRCAPDFIVPLKLHAAPKGYECYMSCAVTGNPKPRITWYRNHVCLNTDTNYYISNTCGVCSMLILSVGPKDVGKYTVTAENTVGRSECSTMLSVRE